MFSKKQIKQIIKNLAIGESDNVSSLGCVERTGRNTYSVHDNGEIVPNVDFDTAVRIATENASND